MAHVIIEKQRFKRYTTHLIDLGRFNEIVFNYDEDKIDIVTPGEKITIRKSNYDEEIKQLQTLAYICRKDFTFQSVEQLQEHFYEELKK